MKVLGQHSCCDHFRRLGVDRITEARKQAVLTDLAAVGADADTSIGYTNRAQRTSVDCASPCHLVHLACFDSSNVYKMHGHVLYVNSMRM